MLVIIRYKLLFRVAPRPTIADVPPPPPPMSPTLAGASAVETSVSIGIIVGVVVGVIVAVVLALAFMRRRRRLNDTVRPPGAPAGVKAEEKNIPPSPPTNNN